MIRHLIPLLGALDHATFRLPVVGEQLLRAKQRLIASVAFHAPILGGKRCRTIPELQMEWLRFLRRLGLDMMVTQEDDHAFSWEIDDCPYGFDKPSQAAVCDACMDLDREYIRRLGGELTILHTIPGGHSRCRFITRLQNGG